MYKMYLGINKGEEGFIVPVLPEKIEISEDGDNKTYNVINIGEVNNIAFPKLTNISFESYFPLNDNPYVSSDELFNPSFYIKKINEWRNNLQKIRFIFTGGPIEINDLFSIENFKYNENGGEVGDIYYSIELKRYKPYAAKRVVIQTTYNGTVAATTSTTETREDTSNAPKEHTVVSGDSLWYIAKRYLGDGSRYNEIATLNGISNPDKLAVGQVLKLP